MTKLYNELAAGWYQLLTPLAEYREEADGYHTLFQEKQSPPPKTVLELGCGAGHNAFYLKQWYTLTLNDVSAPMLAISKKLNPACEHVPGDMRTLRLEKTFDAVFIHDAIMYMTTENELKQALQTAYLHCRPGGMALVSPDYIKEIFSPRTDHGGSDDNGCGMRYLEWVQDPYPDDDTYTVDYAYLLQHADGAMEVAHDHHVEGLFSQATWLTLFREVGFDPYPVPDAFGRVNFIAYKPG